MVMAKDYSTTFGTWKKLRSVAAVIDDIRALAHHHRRDGGHRLDAIDIHFRKLLDEAEDAVQFACHAVCLFLADGDSGKARDALHGG
jgi:hypothetical protein